MPEEGQRDEGDGKQIRRPAIGCQFHDAEQCHEATVSIGEHADVPWHKFPWHDVSSETLLSSILLGQRPVKAKEDTYLPCHAVEL